MREDIDRFWDQWGTLDKLWAIDGGDSCQRVAMYYSLLAIMPDEKKHKYPKNTQADFNKVMALHHVDDGVFIRHPNAKWDASDWDRMSRDQFHPMIIAAGYWSKEHLKKMTKGHLKRGFLFTNNTRHNGSTKRNHGVIEGEWTRDYGWKMPDLTGPDSWGSFIRAWRLWFLWPFLWIFDLDMFIGSIIWRFKDSDIAMNHSLSVLQAKDRLPTPLSWLSTLIMPPEHLVELIGKHFANDDDMMFFYEMFSDAFDL